MGRVKCMRSHLGTAIPCLAPAGCTCLKIPWAGLPRRGLWLPSAADQGWMLLNPNEALPSITSSLVPLSWSPPPFTSSPSPSLSLLLPLHAQLLAHSKSFPSFPSELLWEASVVQEAKARQRDSSGVWKGAFPAHHNPWKHDCTLIMLSGQRTDHV